MGSNGAATSQALIKQLLEAEQQAKDIIATAKKDRIEKLRKAKVMAEDELKKFHELQQSKFDREMGSQTDVDASQVSEASAKKEIDEVHKQHARNKDKTIQFIVGKVLDVQTTLSDTQIQSLKTGVV
mmetsp:Transcript_122176/g.331769  ORF Transcript_122176/g.331769 Transcript_122176/m.331769 type:complete len:127 (-) Transcript_122176:125-505(-)